MSWPVAERLSAQAFLNCYLRELSNWRVGNLGDCRDPEVRRALDRDGAGAVVTIELRSPREEIFAGVRYWSLTSRHQFVFPVFGREADGPLRELDLRSLVTRSMREIESRTAPASSDLRGLLARIVDSTANIAHFLERRAPDIERLYGDGPLSFIDAEQALLIGHPTHPAAKSREGFDAADRDRYSPETRGRFPLRYFRVAPALVHQDSVLDMSAVDIVKAMLRADPTVEDGFKKRYCVDDGFALLPVHPWQAGRVRAEPAVQELFDRGWIEDLGERGRPFTSTTSVRTVYREDAPFMFKLSMYLRVTNSMRVNKSWELDRCVEMPRLAATPEFDAVRASVPAFRWVFEKAYLTVKHEGVVIDGLSCLFRENVFPGGDGRDVSTLATLIQDHPYGGPSRLARIIRGIAARERRDVEKVTIDWYRRFLDVSIRPLLKLFVDLGLCFEPHAQNTLLELKEGYPHRFHYRDGQGYFHREASHGDWNEAMPGVGERTQSIFPEWLANERLVYYMFVNNMFSMVNALGTAGLAPETTLMEELRASVRAIEREGTRYESPMIDRLLRGETLPCKANLLTRLYDMDELVGDIATQSVYVAIANPLRETRP